MKEAVELLVLNYTIKHFNEDLFAISSELYFTVYCLPFHFHFPQSHCGLILVSLHSLATA